jgi:cyclase
MYKPRIIPVLLLDGEGLVKGKKFRNHRYLGDPINAVRIFNDKKVDELIFLDINTNDNGINYSLVENIADECFMPFAVGGGIKSIDEIKELLRCGAEKVVINTYAFKDVSFIEEASNYFGSQSIVVSIDTQKSLFGSYNIYTNSGKTKESLDPVKFAKIVEEAGAGEIMITDKSREGSRKGYNLSLTKMISSNVKIPVIASGGAGKVEHFIHAINKGSASAVSAGTMFVFHGRRDAVLINYMDLEDKDKFIKEVSYDL